MRVRACVRTHRQQKQAPAEVNGIRYDTYQGESQMQAIMDLFAKDLSEPYSIYTYRYFINNWPRLCVLVHVVGHGQRPLFTVHMLCCTPCGVVVAVRAVHPRLTRCLLGTRGDQAFDASSNRMVGSIVCKLDNHRGSYRGYIAMLAVEDGYRKKGIGTRALVARSLAS
jgi:peptide alpha-N-acetyltransferase